MWEKMMSSIEEMKLELQQIDEKRRILVDQLPTVEDIQKQKVNFTEIVRIEVGPDFSDVDKTVLEKRLYFVETDKSPFMIQTQLLSKYHGREIVQPDMLDSNGLEVLYNFICSNGENGAYDGLVDDSPVLETIKRLRERRKVLELQTPAREAHEAFVSMRQKFIQESSAIQYDSILKPMSDLSNSLETIENLLQEITLPSSMLAVLEDAWSSVFSQVSDRDGYDLYANKIITFIQMLKSQV